MKNKEIKEISVVMFLLAIIIFPLSKSTSASQAIYYKGQLPQDKISGKLTSSTLVDNTKTSNKDHYHSALSELSMDLTFNITNNFTLNSNVKYEENFIKRQLVKLTPHALVTITRRR